MKGIIMQGPIHRGILRVHVRTAGGALPVRGAKVTVLPASPEGSSPLVLSTDLSGTTADLPLPAPPASASLDPEPEGPVSAFCTTLTECPGYYAVRHDFTPVFDGVVSIQTVLLVPEAKGIAPGGMLRFGENDAPCP